MIPDDIELAVRVTVALCTRFEGFYSKPYLCPAGVPTIGFGTTFYENGTRVTLFDAQITENRAKELLLYHVRNTYLPRVRAICPGVRDPYLLAALIDFVYNLGAGNLAHSTLARKVNAGSLEQLPAEFMKWVYAAGKKLRGLVARRQAEVSILPHE